MKKRVCSCNSPECNSKYDHHSCIKPSFQSPKKFTKNRTKNCIIAYWTQICKEGFLGDLLINRF